MILKLLPLLKFDGKSKQGQRLSLIVPIGSEPQKLQLGLDGIYVWYKVPSMLLETCVHAFTILGENAEIPQDGELLDIESVIVQIDPESGEQAVVSFPIFWHNKT